MSVKGGYITAKALQRLTFTLRESGLIGDGKFPKLLTPMKVVWVDESKTKDATAWLLAKIEIRPDFKPNQLWVLVKGRAKRVYFSDTQEIWTSVGVYWGTPHFKDNIKLQISDTFPGRKPKIG